MNAKMPSFFGGNETVVKQWNMHCMKEIKIIAWHIEMQIHSEWIKNGRFELNICRNLDFAA